MESMGPEAFKYLGAGLMAFGMLGAAIGVGNIFAAMVQGVARNPATEPKLLKNAFIGAALSEAMGLFSLVIALLLIYAV